MSFLDLDGREQLSWVDDHLDRLAGAAYQEQPLAQDWARVSKVAEELGEAIDALILCTGQNPRKPQVVGWDKVLDELADTALTAIFALQHFTKDALVTAWRLESKLEAIHERARAVEAGEVMRKP